MIRNDLKLLVVIFSLFLIIYVAIWIRLSTINSPTVLDYDPWWFYRYAQTILNNNFKLPTWDVQSFYPGRPVSPFNGWSYTIVFLYKLLSSFSSTTLMKAAIISPLVMVALTAIAAFLVGRLLSNNLGGLITALFIVLAPSLVGTSMAGYCDTDAPVAFYFFFSIFATLLAFKKRNFTTIAFAILANLLFIWNWGGGWLTLILFTVFTFALPFFRVFENMLHTFSLKINIQEPMKELFEVSKPIFFIIVTTNVLGYFLFHSTLFLSFFGGLAFTGLGFLLRILVFIVLLGWCSLFAYNFFSSFKKEKATKSKVYNILGLLSAIFLLILTIQAVLTAPESPLIVNISVAELQPVNIFSREGFTAVISRAGLLTTLLSFGLFVLAFYKIWKKEKIQPEEIFLFLSTTFMFLLISRGVRFDLQFTIIASIAAGYMIGNYKKYPYVLLALMAISLVFLRSFFANTYFELIYFLFILAIPFLAIIKKDEKLVNVLIFAILAFQSLFFISNAIQLGQATGMEISQNWYNALDWLVNNSNKETIVATWWDPGHILAGYSYYKQKPFMVMADGAHCGPNDCIVYDHDIRIHDMGRVFSTNNETEAIEILKKYMGPTQEQCNQYKKTFDDSIYDNPLKVDPCKPMSKMYVIASNDLIGKYYWLSYFGSFDYEKRTGEGRNFIQLQLTNYNQQRGILEYGNGLISIAQKDNKLVAVSNIVTDWLDPQECPRNSIIRDIIFFQQGRQINQRTENATCKGLLFIDPNFQFVIFMDEKIEKSIFTNMFFFNGKGLKDFEIPELKNFELKYSNPEVKIFEVKF
jgi:dolichyl-diphosphooligosaccharide--protein glycosyltransferase